MTVETFGTIAPQLVEHGYEPVPIIRGQKRPAVANWQNGGFGSRAAEFERNYTGILTKDCPAIDIDVSDPALIAQIKAIALDVLDCHELPPPVRIGNAPRELLLLRTEEPFEKLVTADYELPTDPEVNGKRKLSKVEILADGQQFVAFAIHPNTRQPYTWNGSGDPLTVPRHRLVTISQEQAAEIIRRSDELLARHGKKAGKAKITQSTGEHVSNAQLRASDPDACREALAAIPNDDEHYDDWIAMAHAVKAALGEEGLDAFIAWSAKSKKHDEHIAREKWDGIRPRPAGLRRGAGSIFWLARQHGWVPKTAVTYKDFVAFLPAHSYIFTPTREAWPAASVDSRLPPQQRADGKKIKPSLWLDSNASVEQMTWVPGRPMLIKGVLISAGGWIEHPGCTTFNLYRPPEIAGGDPNDVVPWLNHIVRIYGASTDHVLEWLAQRVQHPDEKINHALVLGGAQGIGKDTILEPVKHAVGPWNFAEVSPGQMLGRFNSFVKSVILRVSEARDLGDVDRYAFYDHMKTLTAAPPDVLRCDEKHLREYSVFNVTGVIITTNHKSDGIFLPPDDRRHYVAWSNLTKEDFSAEYWQGLWGWYRSGGIANVVAYLRTREISQFDAKAPPPKTEAWHDIVNANRAPEDGELADLLDRLNHPDALTIDMLIDEAPDLSDISFYLKDRRNRRVIPHRLEAAEYVPVRNPDATDGLWRMSGKRQVIYANKRFSERDRFAAAGRLVDRQSCQ